MFLRALFCFQFFFTDLFSQSALANKKLVIISPHRKSIQNEFIPQFENYYKAKFGETIEVEWLDQGGTENNLRYVLTKLKADPKRGYIDLFWGGGDFTFIDLEHKDCLQPYPLDKELSKQIPNNVAQLNLRSPSNKWHASAVSAFGIFYNKRLAKLLGVEAPKTWNDLGKPLYNNHISMADPRHSSSSQIMNLVILYSDTWQRSWDLLRAIAGNISKFTHSSSDPIKSVISGDSLFATSIDFYAYAKISQLGENSLGFILPQGGLIYNTDPIAILKNSPNKLAAQRFIDFILSPDAQKIYMLPKGHKDGPRFGTLGRMAVNKLAYEGVEGLKNNLYSEKFSKKTSKSVQFDVEKITAIKSIIGDLFGAVIVDPHEDLKALWQYKIKNDKILSSHPLSLPVPLSEQELNDCAKKWSNQIFRNQQINKWTNSALNIYKQELAKLKAIVKTNSGHS